MSITLSFRIDPFIKFLAFALAVLTISPGAHPGAGFTISLKVTTGKHSMRGWKLVTGNPQLLLYWEEGGKPSR
jgi:hypothetical protein